MTANRGVLLVRVNVLMSATLNRGPSENLCKLLLQVTTAATVTREKRHPAQHTRYQSYVLANKA